MNKHVIIIANNIFLKILKPLIYLHALMFFVEKEAFNIKNVRTIDLHIKTKIQTANH